MVCIGLQERQEGAKGCIWGCSAEHQGDLLDVLSDGGEQALLLYFAEASHPGIAVSMQLFGVGEAALNGLFSAFVDALADAIEPVLIRLSMSEAVRYLTPTVQETTCDRPEAVTAGTALL